MKMTRAQIKTQKKYLEIIRELYNFLEYLMKPKEKNKTQNKQNQNLYIIGMLPGTSFAILRALVAAVCFKH